LIHEDAACVHEIVIDGVDQGAIRQAMLQGMLASAGKGVVAISAGNYGGKLGKFHFHLHEILSRPGHPAGI
jgi:formylmethanofuran--tetrahydromethanopterin N-formyltransferase